MKDSRARKRGLESSVSAFPDRLAAVAGAADQQRSHGSRAGSRANPAAPPPPDSPGEVEAAVLTEVASLSASRSHPGLVASVISMARVLDNRLALTTHPSAQRRLQAGLDALRAASAGRKGNLAKVASMSQREVISKSQIG